MENPEIATTVNIGVGELAKEAKGSTKAARFPAIPLQLSLMVTMIPAIALAIIPVLRILGYSLITGYHEQDTVAQVVAGITTELLAAEHVTTAIASNPAIINLFSGPPPYFRDPRINYFMFDQLGQTEPLKKSILSLCQPFNLTGQTPDGTSTDIITQVTWLLRNNAITQCDWTNTTGCYLYPIDPSNGSAGEFPIMKAPFPQPTLRKILYPCQVLSSCPTTGSWKFETLNGAFSLTYGKCSKSSPVVFGASVVVDGTTVVKALFTSLQPTAGSKLFAITSDWKVAGTNGIGNDINQTSKTFYTVTDHPDPIITELGTLIQNQVNGDSSKVKMLDKLINSVALSSDGSRSWFYMSHTLSLNITTPVAIVVAIPFADFFNDIRESQKTSIGLTVGFGCMSIFIVAVIAFGITRPVRSLTRLMSQVTKFDFSVLESSGGLTEQNVFTEIREMEKTFNIMVKAFAAAIKRNKSMVTGTTMSSMWMDGDGPLDGDKDDIDADVIEKQWRRGGPMCQPNIAKRFLSLVVLNFRTLYNSNRKSVACVVATNPKVIFTTRKEH
ncbi:hypothetical protein BJ742DRAFT_733906 [Cladochytrium replicatum]|nr:hypothetical protein BJ742DRAFT_733906 [Cladochytrium replicatum]